MEVGAYGIGTFSVTLSGHCRGIATPWRARVQVMEQCAGLLESVCRRSSLRAAKTVRAQMTSMAALLAADPQLTVIHLLRDPRAVVASRRFADSSVIGKHSIMAGNQTETVRREAVIYCRTAVQDIRVRQALEARYTSSLKLCAF